MNKPYEQSKKIAVVGGGSWGTAIGAWLARNNHDVRLWDIDDAVIKDISQTHINHRYLPDCKLPSNLKALGSLETAMENTSIIVVAVPSRVFHLALDNIKSHLLAMDSENTPIIIWGTKGFASDTGNLLSSVANHTFGSNMTIGCISGPSFAYEVVRGLPAGFTLASNDQLRIEEIANVFRNPTTLVYTTPDMTGVQVGGSTKNVIAIAAGICDGLEFGINARSLLINRGFAEMCRLNHALGGNSETMLGPSGIGDLIMTCTENLSRNRRFGFGLGQGKVMANVIKEIGQEVEGVQSTRETYQLGKRFDVFMPITERVYRIIYENLSPTLAAQELMTIGPSSGGD